MSIISILLFLMIAVILLVINLCANVIWWLYINVMLQTNLINIYKNLSCVLHIDRYIFLDLDLLYLSLK